MTPIPTPSPRPAALDDINAKLKADGWSYSQTEEFRMMLRAAGEIGWTLIHRAELEEAAGALELADTDLHNQSVADTYASRLRQRSRG